jgi:hypothetical protein
MTHPLTSESHLQQVFARHAGTICSYLTHYYMNLLLKNLGSALSLVELRCQLSLVMVDIGHKLTNVFLLVLTEIFRSDWANEPIGTCADPTDFLAERVCSFRRLTSRPI